MSLTLKLGSLVIRTFAKPIGNAIKRNAREHPQFRKLCVGFAQSLHRIDMRLRLGLLQDPEVIERQIAKELAEAEARRRKKAIPTVKTEKQMKDEEEALKHDKEAIEKRVKDQKKHPRIRPLSESKAIDTGATFISETFMFLVAGGVIVFESWRQRKKQKSTREAIDDRVDELKAENQELKAKFEALEIQIAKLSPQEQD